jgi:hypothetical protein
MEVGSIVWFSSRRHPFVVQPTPCLDLACSCSDVWLTLTEVNLAGGRLSEPLSFQLQVCLRHWVERDPPQRSDEVEALAREFLARYPEERIRELVSQWKQQRTIKRRLAEYRADESAQGELLCYSEVIHEEGGIAENGHRYSYFFTHQGREFLLEDYYCPNPACDCRKVDVEFWERIELHEPEHRIEIAQRLMASFTLDGQLDRIQFCQEDAPTAKRLLQAWRQRCAYQFDEFRRRYEQIKAIGSRSFPARPSSVRVDADQGSPPRSPTKSSSTLRAGRNDPCPCGSGLKYKRCCARQRS